MLRVDDREKSKEELLSEVVAYRQWTAQLESDTIGHRKTRKTLKEAEDRFYYLKEFSSDLIMVHQDGRVIDANARFADYVGASMTEVTSAMITDYFSHDSQGKLADETDDGKAHEVKVNATAGETAINARVKRIAFNDSDAHLVVLTLA